MQNKYTKINVKSIFQKLAIVVFGLALAVGASYVSATSRVSDTTTNGPTTLNVGTIDQAKPGMIVAKSFIAGDFISKSSNGYNFTLVDNLGTLSLGKNTSPDSSLGLGLDIGGTKGIIGSMRVKDLESSGLREICADKDGKLVFCVNEKEFFSLYADRPSYYGFIVPNGVTKLTVEIYGAGGSGWSKTNINTGSDNGQSSYFLGDNTSLIAEGGQASDISTIGGKGGAGSVSGASNSLVKDGEDGLVPGSFSPNPLQFGASNICNSATHITVQGANGNDGGKGGKPYNGSNVVGGSGASAAQTYGTFQGKGWSFNTSSSVSPNQTDCNYVGKSSDDFSSTPNDRRGEDGVKGSSYGAGGSGFGGKGGLSAVIQSSDPLDCVDCGGGNSSAGGGAGAYIKADVTTQAGRTYYIKVGNGGKYEKYSCSGPLNTNICLDDLGGGALPGAGADGYVKITFN